MPSARGPYAYAADSKRTSIEGLEKFTGSSAESASVPPRSTSRRYPGGAK
jgi:hypothetical protein